MSNRAARLIGAMVPVAVLLVACEAPMRTPDYGVHAIQFQDVVVPAELRLQADENQSYSLEEAGYRHAHFEYLGSTPIPQASAYVLERMPQHDWSTVADEQPTAGTRRLRFERGRYHAEYEFRRRDGVTFMVVDYRTEIDDR